MKYSFSNAGNEEYWIINKRSEEIYQFNSFKAKTTPPEIDNPWRPQKETAVAFKRDPEKI